MPAGPFDPSLCVSPHLPDFPVKTRADVIALLPDYMQDPAPDMIRDAIADALLAMIVKRQNDIANGAAAADPAYALGDDLAVAGRSRGIAFALNEPPETFRSRMLAGAAISSPSQAMAAIAAITARVSSFQPYYWDLPYDDIFVKSKTDTSDAGTYLHSRASGIDSTIVQPKRYRSVRPYAGPPVPMLLNTPKLTRGPTIIALPLGRGPSVAGPNDGFIFSKTRPNSLIDAAAPTVVAKADVTDTYGAIVPSSGSDTAIILAQIQALLDQTSAFPSKFMFCIIGTDGAT